MRKRCFRLHFSNNKWVRSKRGSYKKTCKKYFLKCKWSKVGFNNCFRRVCYKKYKNNQIKRWNSKKICFEKRKNVCKIQKIKHHCHIKTCCSSINYNGRVISNHCRKSRRCAKITRRKCLVKKTSKTIIKKCCLTTKKGNRIIKRHCNKRVKHLKLIKKRCHKHKNKKTCCKYRYCYKSKSWKRLKVTCRSERKTKTKQNICRWLNIGNKCFHKQCCVSLNGVIGSTKCQFIKKLCLLSKKKKVFFGLLEKKIVKQK